jgi:hypothetical protein
MTALSRHLVVLCLLSAGVTLAPSAFGQMDPRTLEDQAAVDFVVQQLTAPSAPFYRSPAKVREFVQAYMDRDLWRMHESPKTKKFSVGPINLMLWDFHRRAESRAKDILLGAGPDAGAYLEMLDAYASAPQEYFDRLVAEKETFDTDAFRRFVLWSTVAAHIRCTIAERAKCEAGIARAASVYYRTLTQDGRRSMGEADVLERVQGLIRELPPGNKVGFFHLAIAAEFAALGRKGETRAPGR